MNGRIVVIGAGVAGVAAATALRAANLEFVVYESRSGVGGLWFQNYPGASGTLFPSFMLYCITGVYTGSAFLVPVLESLCVFSQQ